MALSFAKQLTALGVDESDRSWLLVPYDQLCDGVGPLARERPRDVGIVLVENPWKARRRRYHKQKLALVLTNMRHFALEQARRGVAVRYVHGDGPYDELLREVCEELGPLRVMRPAERELREDLAPLMDAGLLEEVPHEGWLTTSADFDAALDAPPWRMDSFYRHVRRRSGILMDGDGKPVGGTFSFDAENRKPWKGEPAPPMPLEFEPDDVTREVGELVATVFEDHPGTLDLKTLPASSADAEAVWRRALDECMESFGTFEDAMTTRSRYLFHTRISPLLNLGRLLAADVVADVLESGAPLNSREGFVRQIIGWREFMRHVHERTDGLRRRPDGAELDANRLRAGHPLPPAYWGAKSGLHCLDVVVESVWEEGYSHHITRLMVLSNIATLLGFDPRETTDWFWCAYVDAFDWVVEPNVLGMGTFALGQLFTTKPYVSGAAYINRMSDYCRSCAFDPRKDCPLTRAYWSFLARNREALDANARMAMPLRSLAKRGEGERAEDARVTETLIARLAEGAAVEPATFLE